MRLNESLLSIRVSHSDSCKALRVLDSDNHGAI
jgi:hypothetical protein